MPQNNDYGRNNAGYPGGNDPGYQRGPNRQGDYRQGYPGGNDPRYQRNPNQQGNYRQGYPGGNDPRYQRGPNRQGNYRQDYPRQDYPRQGYSGGSRYPDNRSSYYQNNGPEKRKGGAGTVVIIILLVIALGVFCFAAWKLYGYYRDYRAGTEEYDALRDEYGENGQGSSEAETQPGGGIILNDVTELEDPETVEAKKEQAATEETEENNETKQLPLLRNPVDFEQLQQINEDIIGWIRIGALDVSYPVAQGADNDYYLHRTFERQDNFAGCIFLNCENSKFFTDQNSIVYGHNMKNGSMFGTLKNYRDQKTYDTNPYFWIFTPELIYQYRIFSSSEVSASGEPYKTRFTTQDFESFLQSMKAGSLIQTGVTPTAQDRIVTLSTCTGNDATRFVVQGVLEQVYISK